MRADGSWDAPPLTQALARKQRGFMKRSGLAITIMLFVLFSGFAFAADRPNEKAEDVVKRLYHDFGWELKDDISKKRLLIDQPANVLAKYFTNKLSEMIVKDRNYVKRTKELGHLDFVLLCGSQDPGGISNIRIRQAAKNRVTLTYDQNGEKDIMTMDFSMVSTSTGWRITDVSYKERKSNGFPTPSPTYSLSTILSEPY
jgi:hypothetical protein